MSNLAIHQFVHTLHYGDAISGEALTIRSILQAQGIESEIFSLHTHPKLKQFARPWTEFAELAAKQQDEAKNVAVLFHYSIGSPLGELLLETPGITRMLVYHNLTPEHWFRAYNPRVTSDLIAGREELPGLLSKMDVVLADSEFNRNELTEMGCNSAQVLPLVLDEEKWRVTANKGIAKALGSSGEVNILHVGRIAPNKCIEDILKSFYFYHHKIEKKSKLWLIGGEIDTELYAFELRRMVTELRLKEAVRFVGSVADSELRAFYEGSDCYLCMSEHEGFCVPLLEAMHFGLPVVAYDAGAVSATLKGGGILLKEKRHAEVAELMNSIISSPDVSRPLIEAGKQRVSEFGPTAFASSLQKLVVEPLKLMAVNPQAEVSPAGQSATGR